jgi:hypothetical protein
MTQPINEEEDSIKRAIELLSEAYYYIKELQEDFDLEDNGICSEIAEFLGIEEEEE